MGLTDNRLKARLLQSYRLVCNEGKCYFCSLVGRYRVWHRFDVHGNNQIELGPGDCKPKPGFKTIDLNLTSDYPYDLRFGLPFADGTLDVIYAEHVLEHFEFRDLQFLLRDCYRCLRCGGILSVVVPDARKYVESYISNDLSARCDCRYDWGLAFHSPVDYLNYIFYMDGGHRYMFDQQHGLAVIRATGFEEVEVRAFDPALDRADRQYESLYFVARKVGENDAMSKAGDSATSDPTWPTGA